MKAKYQGSLTTPKVPGFVWPEPEDERDRETVRNILTHGCSILSVTPGKENPRPYDFTYTLGFYLNLLHPEFLIFGISLDVSARLMNALFSAIEAGDHIGENDTFMYDLGLGEKKLIAKRVPRERYNDYFGYGCWFYRSLQWNVTPIAEYKFPVLQLVWPDAAGLYPWDPGCDPRVRDIQTLRA